MNNNGKLSEPFTPILDDLAREIGLIKAAVVGSIWRFCQMETGKCTASNQTIGERCGLERTTVNKAIKALVEAKMIIDHTPDRKKSPHDLTPSVDLINRFNGVIVDKSNRLEEKSGPSVDLINTNNDPSVDSINSSEPSVDLITSSVDLITQRDSKKQNTSRGNEKSEKPPSPWFNEKGQPTSKHPAIVAFRSVMHRYPRKNQYSDIATTVGESEDDVSFWKKVVAAWNLTPYAPTNIGGMLDCYKRRQLPTTRNGTGKQSEQQPTTSTKTDTGGVYV